MAEFLRVSVTFIYSQLEDFKVAQQEQERQIEKEISNRERDINCLKHYRSRCVEIVSEARLSSGRRLTSAFAGIRVSGEDDVPEDQV